MRFNQINSVQKFNQLNSKFIFLNGEINPFVNLRHEYRNKGYRFDDMLFGVGFFKKKRSFSIGIGRRSDWVYDFPKNLMSLSKSSEFIELDYKYVDLKGWKIIDRYNNIINFSLNIIAKNEVFKKGTFKIPEIN